MIIKRKNETYQIPLNWFNATNTNDNNNVITIKIFVNLLISQSTEPTLVFGLLIFITERLSLPVYITKPIDVPWATTQLAQSVFSTSNGIVVSISLNNY